MGHEIGHARWPFRHPSTQFGIWDELRMMLRVFKKSSGKKYGLPDYTKYPKII